MNYVRRLYKSISNEFFNFKKWNKFFTKNLFFIHNLDVNYLNKKNRILFATSLGGEKVAWRLEMLLSLALKFRKYRSEFILCDKTLSACQMCTFKHYKSDLKTFSESGPKDLCESCFERPNEWMTKFGFKVHTFSKYLTSNDFFLAKKLTSELTYNEIITFKFKNISIGEHALAGALRFFAVGTLGNQPYSDKILRQYFESSLLTAFSFINLFKKNKFDVVVLHHGIYVPQGIIVQVAKSMGVRVVVWNIAYREKRFIFSHGDTYHHTLIEENPDTWKKISLGRRHKDSLKKYLDSRSEGSKDWISFHNEKSSDKLDFISEKLKLKKDITCIGLLTNVIWDAQLHYPSNAFKDMLQWVIKTIEYFSTRKDLQLIIRIHPAEANGNIPSRQLVFDEINKIYKNIPDNVHIVLPKDPVSSYVLMSICDTILIYGTKMGVEMTYRGKPVIVAGEAWIKNKGITYDPESEAEYFHLLNSLPFRKNISLSRLKLAEKYAFHFFYRRMIPIKSVQRVSGWPPFDIGIENISELAPGIDKGLDIILDGIVLNTPFVYPEELID